MNIFFGLLLSQTAMLRKLNFINVFHRITKLTIETLCILTFAIAIFDNSQIFRMLKYQRGGHSSSATMCTSRMFVLAMIPLLIEFFNFPSEEDRPEIVYLDQPIPSAYGMPAYENIRRITARTFEDPLYKIKNQSMDITGARVEKYTDLVVLSHLVYRFRRILPFNVREFSYQTKAHQISLR